MASIGDALLAFTGGAAEAINDDAAEQRKWEGKMKALAQERNDRVAETLYHKKYESHQKDQEFWNTKQEVLTATDSTTRTAMALQLMQSKTGMTAEMAKTVALSSPNAISDFLNTVTQPGEEPAWVSTKVDPQKVDLSGRTSLGTKLKRKLLKMDERRSTLGTNSSKANRIALQGARAMATGRSDTPLALDFQTSDELAAANAATAQQDIQSIEQTLTVGKEKASTSFATEFLKPKPTIKVDLDKTTGQVIVTKTDADGNLIGNPVAKPIKDFKKIGETRFEDGLVLWTEQTGDGDIVAKSKPIEGFPKDANNIKIESTIWNKELGAFQILERDTETGKTTASLVELSDEDMEKLKSLPDVRLVSYESEDPETGEKRTITTLIDISKGKIKLKDAVNVTTGTRSSTTVLAPSQDRIDEFFTDFTNFKNDEGLFADLTSMVDDDIARATISQIDPQSFGRKAADRFQDLGEDIKDVDARRREAFRATLSDEIALRRRAAKEERAREIIRNRQVK